MCMEDIRLGRKSPANPESLRDHRSDDFASTPTLIIPPSPNRTGLLIFGRQLIFGDNPEIPSNSREGFVSLYLGVTDPLPKELDPAGNNGRLIVQLGGANTIYFMRIETHGQLVEQGMILVPANWDIVSPTEVYSWASYTEIETREWVDSNARK